VFVITMFRDMNSLLLLIINAHVIVYKLTVNLRNNENNYLLRQHELNLKKMISTDFMKSPESPLNYSDREVSMGYLTVIMRSDTENMSVRKGFCIG